MGRVGDIWDFVGPPPDIDLSEVIEISDQEKLVEINHKARALWFWKVKVSAMLAGGILFALWSITPIGFVRASDVSQVAEKTIKPLKEQVDAVEKKLGKIEEQNKVTQTSLNELVSGKVATDICRVVRRIATETDRAEKINLRIDADNLQTRYRGLVGENYPETRCQ
jgi:hypothetical protein